MGSATLDSLRFRTWSRRLTTSTQLQLILNFTRMNWGKQEAIQSVAAEDHDDSDFRSDDLRQENNILRQELAILYTKFLTSHIDQHKREYSDCECQTDDPMLFKVPVVHEKITNLVTELAHQKLLNIEQAKRAKEADRNIHNLELKILDMNLEILQAAPIKAKIEELTTLTENQQSKLSSATNEYLNLTVEVNHHKNTIDSLHNQLNQKSDTITNLLAQITQLEETVTDLRKQVGHKESQLESALYLNTEYQAKLHKDDLQFFKWSGELNHYERKCESQSKEIVRLNDSLDNIRLQLQQTTRELTAAKAEKAASVLTRSNSSASTTSASHLRTGSASSTSPSKRGTAAATSTAAAHNRARSASGGSGGSATSPASRSRPGIAESLDVEDCVCPDFSFSSSSGYGKTTAARDPSHYYY